MAGFGRAVPGKAMGRDGRIGDREWRHCRTTDETVQQDRDATMARGQHCACDSSDFPSTQPPQRLKSSGGRIRSEEHTSELQSLMRISSAVFFFKKTYTPLSYPVR